MPDGYVAWVIWLFVSTTVFWAAVWWWLPALFKDRDREPPHPPSSAQAPRPDDEGQDPGAKGKR